MSLYMQLSRTRSLKEVPILRPFYPSELTAPMQEYVIEELEWEDQMSEVAMQIYL
jgi:hypothetical protein